MPMRDLLAVSLALALLACAEPPPPRDDSSRGDAAATARPPGDTARAVLALDGEGLRAFLRPSGSARPIPFGEPRASVLATVGRLQDGARPALTPNEECRATVATWPATGLQLWFTTGSAPRFVGWSLGGRAPADTTAPALTTASGIGLGSTRAALESVYVARVARSTLGVEFSAGGLAGLLASDRPDAPIRNLWAGEVCLAR